MAVKSLHHLREVMQRKPGEFRYERDTYRGRTGQEPVHDDDIAGPCPQFTEDCQMSGAATISDPWDTYIRWNNALADVIYGPAAADTPVYLDLEDDVLHAVGEAAGGGGDDPRGTLLAVVRPTLYSPNHMGGMFRGHVLRLRRWRRESGDPPPVIGLLAILCLAAEDMRESDGLAANNYYDRLMPLLGVTSHRDKMRVIDAYRKVSFDLWESLNGWLESLHGERGVPTAYAYAHEHIGRPMSQALVRTADRTKLNEFFVELGMEPRSRLSASDMESLIAAWISRTPSPASQQIQALWKRPGARERIVDVACHLLETWEPQPGSVHYLPTGNKLVPRRSGLRLLANRRTFPSPALELNVVGHDIGGERVASLQGVANAADGRMSVALDDLPDGRWRLAEVNEIEKRSLLEGAIHLSFSTGAALYRHPRRVVPLKKDDLLQAFVEVERLGLGEEGMILCISHLGLVVEDALSQIARPGFQRTDHASGCPDGWVVFDHINVLAPLFSATPPRGLDWPLDLNALQPLATSQLVIQGGLQLPGRVRRWSSRAAPEVRASAEGADSLHITMDRVGVFQGSTRVLDTATDEPFALIDLQELDLEDGDYEINAVARSSTAKTRPISASRLRLRSGSSVGPTPTDRLLLARRLDRQALGVVAASPWDEESTAVRGAAVLSSSPQANVALTHSGVGVPGWWTLRRDPSRPRASKVTAPAQVFIAAPPVSDCFQTGAHYLDLPTSHGKPTSATIEGVCRYCGLVKRFPGSYYRARKRGYRRERPTSVAPNFHLSDMRPVLSDVGVSPDIALDALSHDLAGPASWLEQLALQVEPSQLFVDRFVRGLDLLAHIEVQVDEKTLGRVAWEVLPPALVETTAGAYALCGQRSRLVEDAVESAACCFDSAIERTAQGIVAPDRLLLLTRSPEKAKSIAELAADKTGIQFQVVNEAARQLAAALPPLSAIVDRLPRQAMVAARSINRWATDLARWEAVGDASVPGAYQLRGPTPLYCIRDDADIENGTMRRVDARFAKHIGALTTGECMTGYDKGTSTLYVPLGADLPGLYGRAAVLCSGLLPTEDDRQRVTRYSAVPRDIAEHLAGLLAC